MDTSRTPFLFCVFFATYFSLFQRLFIPSVCIEILNNLNNALPFHHLTLVYCNIRFYRLLLFQQIFFFILFFSILQGKAPGIKTDYLLLLPFFIYRLHNRKSYYIQIFSNMLLRFVPTYFFSKYFLFFTTQKKIIDDWRMATEGSGMQNTSK